MAERLLHGVEVLLEGGDRLKVFIEAEVGDFAVHLRVWGRAPVGPGYSVTHIPSGIAIWSVLTLGDAVRVAQYLDKAKRIPNDRDAAMAWREHFSMADRSQLIKDLTAIAPRFTGRAVT